MSVTVTMPQSSTSQPDLWKPRFAALQHQKVPAQPIARASSLREPFDAAELTRKLESYRQELKLERARRELAEKKKTEKKTGNENVTAVSPAAAAAAAAIMGPPAQKKKESSPQREPKLWAAVSRSKSLNVSKKLDIDSEPEWKRSLMYPLRRGRQEVKEKEQQQPAEPTIPYVPRAAGRQFRSTTTPLKDKKETKERKEKSRSPARSSERKDSRDSKAKDTNPSHKLDWDLQSIPTKSSSPPPPAINDPIDEETKQHRIQAMQTFNAASKPCPRPLSTALENFRVWDNEPQSNPYSQLPNPIQEQPHQDDPSTQRTQLKQSDRHDWSQASQCGDSERQSLHLFPLKGRKKDVAGENAEIAGLVAAKEGGKRKPRQKSHGDQPDRLVADAVKLIREERRKTLFLGIFKRH